MVFSRCRDVVTGSVTAHEGQLQTALLCHADGYEPIVHSQLAVHVINVCVHGSR